MPSIRERMSYAHVTSGNGSSGASSSKTKAIIGLVIVLAITGVVLGTLAGMGKFASSSSSSATSISSAPWFKTSMMSGDQVRAFCIEMHNGQNWCFGYDSYSAVANKTMSFLHTKPFSDEASLVGTHYTPKGSMMYTAPDVEWLAEMFIDLSTVQANHLKAYAVCAFGPFGTDDAVNMTAHATALYGVEEAANALYASSYSKDAILSKMTSCAEMNKRTQCIQPRTTEVNNTVIPSDMVQALFHNSRVATETEHAAWTLRWKYDPKDTNANKWDPDYTVFMFDVPDVFQTIGKDDKQKQWAAAVLMNADAVQNKTLIKHIGPFDVEDVEIAGDALDVAKDDSVIVKAQKTHFPFLLSSLGAVGILPTQCENNAADSTFGKNGADYVCPLNMFFSRSELTNLKAPFQSMSASARARKLATLSTAGRRLLQTTSAPTSAPSTGADTTAAPGTTTAAGTTAVPIPNLPLVTEHSFLTNDDVNAYKLFRAKIATMTDASLEFTDSEIRSCSVAEISARGWKNIFATTETPYTQACLWSAFQAQKTNTGGSMTAKLAWNALPSWDRTFAGAAVPVYTTGTVCVPGTSINDYCVSTNVVKVGVVVTSPRSLILAPDVCRASLPN